MDFETYRRQEVLFYLNEIFEYKIPSDKPSEGIYFYGIYLPLSKASINSWTDGI